MASSTVKTHLSRLKARTDLSVQEIFLQRYNNRKSALNLEDVKEPQNFKLKKVNKKGLREH
jgi:hypothetical protein